MSADVVQLPLQYVKGVGPRRAADLRRVGLVTVEDLLHRLPLRYEDRGRLEPIARLRPGETASVAGQVLSCGVRLTRRPGFKIFEMVVRDETAAIRATWLNQPFLRDVFQPHQRVILYGKVEVRRPGGLQLLNPQYEIVERASDVDADEGETIHTGRIVPIYEKVGTVTPKMQRRIVYTALQRLPPALEDPLPVELRQRLGLPDRRTALGQAHFAERGTSLDLLNRFRTPPQVRLIFEEFFLFQLGLLLRRRLADAESKPRVPVVDDRVRQSALRVLPFKLTDGQKQALREIVADIERRQPMNRLLEGDVGSGKTIVALLAALVAMENDLQVAFMAPTEILAEQHYLRIKQLLAPSRFRGVLLTGAMGLKERRQAHADLVTGAAHFAVGTHALVQGPVAFRALGLVVIDEQHRFGVVQRATLRAKGLNPDVLVMTATPIPRTLALTMYGDLDVSVIRDLPPGRRRIRTVIKPETRREQVYEFVRRQLDQSRQAYIVYPLVEESRKVDLKAATAMADHLAQVVFPEYRVALLHGQLKEDAKDRVMTAFAQGRYDVLVATTVIEVGIDVPNATVMVIEHAERFGLAQLHQLRGRVGRGAHQSSCILLYQPPLADQARQRLKTLAETSDGFLIAERDLQLRGPGDFFGTRQAGIPTLRVGDLARDQEILELAREQALGWIERAPVDSAGALTNYVQATWARRFGLVEVG